MRPPDQDDEEVGQLIADKEGRGRRSQTSYSGRDGVDQEVTDTDRADDETILSTDPYEARFAFISDNYLGDCKMHSAHPVPSAMNWSPEKMVSTTRSHSTL